MSNVVTLGALAVVAIVAGGCAVHRPHVPPGGVRADAADRAFAPTIEAQDPALAEALARLAAGGGPSRHRDVAQRYVELGILDSAFDHFAAARRLDPADGAAVEGLARVWREWGFLDRALEEAATAVQLAPSAPSSHNTLGTILQALGRLEAARSAFENARSLDPDAAYAASNLCYVSLLTGALTQAIEECRGALALDPDFTPARNNLALVYAVGRQSDRARQEFEAAGDPAAALYNIGLVHLAEGRYGLATEAFDAASRQRPSWSAPRRRARVSRQLAAHHEARQP